MRRFSFRASRLPPCLALTRHVSLSMKSGFVVRALLLSVVASPLVAQVPVEWRDSLVFHTFSIAAIDPRTGEVGVAVTTRVPCVGGGVPWVRVGAGARAT